MRILMLIGFLLLTACNPAAPALSEADQQLLESLDFDADLMADVRSHGESFEQLEGITAEYQPYLADGLLLSTRPQQGRTALARIRTILRDSQYSAYLYDEAYGYGPDRIAVIKSLDEYDYLAVVRTDGINYDLEHNDVLARYRTWDQMYGLSLNGAGQDWLEATFATPPDDWMSFAQEVYDFCPDVVDQGTGDIESLADEMRRSNFVYLWWD